MDFSTPDPPVTRGSLSLTKLTRPGPNATDRDYVLYFMNMAVLLEDRCRTASLRPRWWIVTVINSSAVLLIMLWLLCLHTGHCQ